ncbi:MAG: hypothetical protein A2V76_08125 [Candidatus Aminicenantes bacterium RBG_16_63_14]|nr:MAG: hypothetical protein A2V76_08125 [Candidatus Aminicenantes bacterium RBG_16_63_14]
MRCGTAKKRLSDDLDGALAPERKDRLEAHLRSCPACRAYRDDLVLLQAGALYPADRSPECWAAFEKRLESKLAGEEPGRGAVGIPFSGRRRWAWAAAGGMALAAAGLWFALLRPGTAVTAAWVPDEDALIPLLQEAEADPELERDVDREIRASIEEMTPVLDADIIFLPAADPLFWESLSDDELRFIASELEKETGLGGPK